MATILTLAPSCPGSQRKDPPPPPQDQSPRLGEPATTIGPTTGAVPCRRLPKERTTAAIRPKLEARMAIQPNEQTAQGLDAS